jgi:hypothetical protein
MKSTNKHFALEPGEYLVTVYSPDSEDYTVYYKDEKLHDVVGLVRNKNAEKAFEEAYK